ncbi:MAG: LPS assembly protein LptD [Desulfovibrionaceae bacterium]
MEQQRRYIISILILIVCTVSFSEGYAAIRQENQIDFERETVSEYVLEKALASLSINGNNTSFSSGEGSYSLKMESGSHSLKDTLINSKISTIQSGKWKITADTLTSQRDSTILEAQGNVTIQNGDLVLRADFIRYYTETDWVYLEGNTEITFEDSMKVHAQKAEINLKNLHGYMYEALVRMSNPYVEVRGEVLERKVNNKYLFKNTVITVCDTETKAWSVLAYVAEIDIEGYATLYNFVLDIYGYEVLRIPRIEFPFATKRKSGFLLPELAISSSKGVEFEIGYYFAIDEKSDMLLSSRIMSQNGVMLSGMYRARYSPESTLWLAGNWIYEVSIEDYISPVTQDRYKADDNRYWLRGMYNTLLGESRWRLQLDVDYASDLVFASDYKSGMVGSDVTFDQTFELFGRDFNPLRQNRKSKAVISSSYDRFGVAFSSTYEQNLLAQDNAIQINDSKVVDQLPSAQLFLHRQRVLGDIPEAKYFPVEVEGILGSTYFVRDSGANGLRADITPKIYVPFQLEYFSITSSAILNQRVYFTEKNGLVNSVEEKDIYVFVPEYATVIESHMARAYSISHISPLEEVGDSRWTGVMHKIKPWASYTNRPYVNQNSIPNFTVDDRLGVINAVGYGITTSLVRKKETVVIAIEEKDGIQVPKRELSSDYLEFLRVQIWQEYYPSLKHTPYKNNISPLGSEIEYFYDSALSLRVVSRLDLQTGEIIRGDVTVFYTLKDYSLSVGYDYQKKAEHYDQNNKISSIYVGLETPVVFSMQAKIRYGYDIVRNKSSEISAALSYVDQCYSIGLSYYQDFFGTSVGFLFSVPVFF